MQTARQNGDEYAKQVQRRIGERIRQLRKEKGLTQEDVAGPTGTTKSLISKIEKGHVSAPINTLLRITTALEVSLTDIFINADNQPPSYIVVREKTNNKKTVKSKGSLNATYDYYGLAAPKDGVFQPLLIDIEPAREMVPAPVNHKEQEFLFVVSGNISILFEEEEVLLKQGDSIFIESNTRHQIKSKDVSKLLVVLIKPTDA